MPYNFVTAEELQNNSSIESYTNALLEDIDLIIKSAENTFGMNVIEYILPSYDPKINLSRQLFEIIVYTAIVKHLMKRGFETWITANQEKKLSTLHVKWINHCDDKEINEMKKFLLQNYRN